MLLIGLQLLAPAQHSLGELWDKCLKVHQCTRWLPTSCQLPSVNNLLCDGAVHAGAVDREGSYAVFSISCCSAPPLDVLLPPLQRLLRWRSRRGLGNRVVCIAVMTVP